jgi:hypothetical protein
MALLYQEIMNVPGLSGRWQDRNRQLYEKLGSPMGVYQGNLQQNLYLLDQIRKNNYFKSGLPGQVKATTPTPEALAPKPAPTVKDTATTAAKETVPQTPWGDVMPWEQYFDPNLVKSSAAQQTSRYFDPQVQQGREGIEGDFAGRNLTRSGQRGEGVLDMYRDFADKEATMIEQLYGQREGEAREDYGFQQGLYEESPKGYEATKYKVDPYEYQYPEESAQRYSKSYRDWLRSAYKM